MATRKQIDDLRAKYEKDSFGTGGRSATKSDGRLTEQYAEWLEHWVAAHYYEPKPVKVSKAKQERINFFTRGK